ncbi:MAG: CpsB/CapC family capsule biosynthesis tyrosine phosphatase [Myxococcota bacterium]
MATIERLVERGVKMQIELGSFVKLYGKSVNVRALALADKGLGHVLASDMHRPKDADIWLPAALRSVRERYGKQALELATLHNPQALIDNQGLEMVNGFTQGR